MYLFNFYSWLFLQKNNLTLAVIFAFAKVYYFNFDFYCFFWKVYYMPLKLMCLIYFIIFFCPTINSLTVLHTVMFMFLFTLYGFIIRSLLESIVVCVCVSSSKSVLSQIYWDIYMCVCIYTIGIYVCTHTHIYNLKKLVKIHSLPFDSPLVSPCVVHIRHPNVCFKVL